MGFTEHKFTKNFQKTISIFYYTFMMYKVFMPGLFDSLTPQDIHH